MNIRRGNINDLDILVKLPLDFSGEVDAFEGEATKAGRSAYEKMELDLSRER